MARKNYTAEQIIGMLRKAEVRLSQGEKQAPPAVPQRAAEGTRFVSWRC